MSDKSNPIDEIDNLEAHWVSEDSDDEDTGGFAKYKERLKQGISKDNAKGIKYSFFTITLGTAFMVIFASLGTDESNEQQIVAARISESDVPLLDESAAPIYGVDSLEYKAIRNKEDEDFVEAAEKMESSIDSLEFFNAADNLQRSAVVNDVDIREESSYLDSVISTEDYINKKINPDKRSERNSYNKANLRVAYDFRQMLENAAVEHEEWSTAITEMAASTKNPIFSSDSGNYIVNSKDDRSSGQADPDAKGNPNITSVVANQENLTNPIYHKILPTEIQWAMLTSECNTDEPGIIGEIISGPIKGASLMGTCSITPLMNVAMEFNLAVYDDQPYPIDAIALDAKKLRQSMPADVDRHFFSRYIPFLISKFAGAYATSLITTTQLDTDDSKVTQVNGIPDTSTQLKYAAGETLASLLPGLEAGLDRPPTGTVPQYKVFPILFRSEQIIN